MPVRITLLLSLFGMFAASGVYAVEIEGSNKVATEVKAHLVDILIAAELDSAKVTRGSSTPQDQARVMFDYYLRDSAPNCKPGKVIRGHACSCETFEERKACAKATYAPIGDAALDSIVDFSNRSEAIESMVTTISARIEAAGENRNELAHVPIAGRYAVDVAPSSITNHERFKKAVYAHPSVIKSRFFYPGKVGGPAESAFHIEFRVD